MALPLTLPDFFLDPTCYVQVTVSPDYYTARCDFNAGPTTIYSLTLLQTAPLQELPKNLKVGDVVIESGSLKLQLPSPIQKGTATLNCTYTSLNVKQPTQLNSVVASWTLNQ